MKIKKKIIEALKINNYNNHEFKNIENLENINFDIADFNNEKNKIFKNDENSNLFKIINESESKNLEKEIKNNYIYNNTQLKKEVFENEFFDRTFLEITDKLSRNLTYIDLNIQETLTFRIKNTANIDFKGKFGLIIYNIYDIQDKIFTIIEENENEEELIVNIPSNQ